MGRAALIGSMISADETSPQIQQRLNWQWLALISANTRRSRVAASEHSGCAGLAQGTEGPGCLNGLTVRARRACYGAQSR